MRNRPPDISPAIDDGLRSRKGSVRSQYSTASGPFGDNDFTGEDMAELEW